MFKAPVVVTTLEEDFKKIGLIKDEPTVEETDEQVENETEGDESEEGLDEARRIRKRTVAGGRKMMTTKRTSAADRMKGKRNYRRKKMKIKLAKKKKMRSSKFRRRAKFLAKRAAARRGESTETNSLAGLIESTKEIVSTLGTPASAPSEAFAEAVKSFANIAIIADLLSTKFEDFAGDLSEDQLDEAEEAILANFEAASLSLADLAEAAADIATKLKNGEEPESMEELEAIFKEYMEDLVEGLDFYNEAKGDDAEDAEDDEESDEDDSEDDDSEEETESKSGKSKGR